MLPKDTALISDTIASKTKMLPTTIQNVDLSGLFLLRNAIMDNIKKSKPNEERKRGDDPAAHGGASPGNTTP